MKNYIKCFLVLALANTFVALGQENAKKDDLNTRYQAFVKGELATIGNGILNFKTGKNGTSSEYDERIKNSKRNDDFSVEYIDVDDDKETFSSSSAQFVSGYPTIGNVVFAGLYWSATYPFEKGRLNGKTAVPDNKDKSDFTMVKIKLPKEKKYKDIKGDVVFDGSKTGGMVNAPYVVFADVTNIVKALKSPEGEYTVANVRATNGNVEGGSSAGWTLVIVYDKPDSQLKKIEIKDGFQVISENYKETLFGNFRINGIRKASARIAGAVLGADANIGTNQISVITEKMIVPMYTNKRGAANFLNSSITQDDNYFMLRTPRSLNTLGFDIFNNEISNFENSLLPKGSSGLEVQTYSKGQNAYLFMLALAVDSDNVPLTRAPERIKRPEGYANPASQEKKEEVKTTKTTTPEGVRSIKLKGVDKGYYIVLGSYSSKAGADRLVAKYKKGGMKEALKIYNDARKVYYVCYAKADAYDQALAKQLNAAKLFKKKPAFSKLKPWILAVE